MAKGEETAGSGSGAGLEIKEEDIMTAMGEIPGYLDITPGDFKEIYLLAFQHALERLSREVAVGEIMTREVVFVKMDTPLAEVAAAMGQRGISGVPVVSDSLRWPGWSPRRISCGPWGCRSPRTS